VTRGLQVRRNGTEEQTPFEVPEGVRTVQQGMYELLGRSRSTLYSEEMWKALDDYSPVDDLSLTNDRMAEWHPLNQASYMDHKIVLPGILLSAKGDRSAMNSSVEIRPPFLDEDVVAFVASIHPDYKLRRRTEKWLLREVARRILPAEIAERPKYAFRAYYSRTFLESGHPEWVDELLSEESLQATGYFDPRAVAESRARLERARRFSPGRYSLEVSMTSVIATQLWHHTWMGGGLADLPTWESAPTSDI